MKDRRRNSGRIKFFSFLSLAGRKLGENSGGGIIFKVNKNMKSPSF